MTTPRQGELSAADVRKVARLARLDLPDEAVERYRGQLAAVLGYMERLRGLDLAGVEPLVHVGEGVNRLDADEPGPVLPEGVLERIAPAVWKSTALESGATTEGGATYFQVPKGAGRRRRGVRGMSEIAGAVAARRVTAAEVCREALARIDAAKGLNAFLQVFHDRATEQAKAVDARIAKGDAAGPLAGVPVALKDNICLEWGRTTAGSRMLEGYESPYSATAARRLIDAGAVIVGKTNLDEFAMGSSGENSAFGPTRNPWDETRVPGGSSSGSAAAVAAGLVPLGLGSDTGGSIRQPAGWCGLVGVKPTYGRVSRYGLIAYASSLDQIGPLTRTVGDAAGALNVLCGPDALDATSAQRPADDFAADLETPVKDLTIGVPRQARSGANHAGVAGALERAAAVYRDAGARIVEVDLPHANHGIAAYYLVATAEASANLARFDGVRYGRRAELRPGEGLEALYSRTRTEGFGAEVQRRIMLGTHVLSSGYYDAYYVTALKVRRKIKGDFDGAWVAGCHALLMPTSPGPALKIGEKSGDPLAMYLEDVYTVGVNLAGLPAIAMPGGFAEEGGKRLPVGVQLVGPAWSEATLLRIARTLERASEPAPPLVYPVA